MRTLLTPLAKGRAVAGESRLDPGIPEALSASGSLFGLGLVNTNPIVPAEAVFCPARQNERGIAGLHERMITPLGGKTAPALWVTPREAEEGPHVVGIRPSAGRKPFDFEAGRFADHRRSHPPLRGGPCSAPRTAPEKAPLGVACRSFGITKLHSSRLDWRFFRRNRTYRIRVNGP